MSDREKVIQGLQCIIDGTVRCESCGYAIDKHGHHSCQQNCASEAIAMLKEQEERKIGYWLVYNDGQEDEFAVCSKCGEEWEYNSIYPDKCPKCGEVMERVYVRRI